MTIRHRPGLAIGLAAALGILCAGWAPAAAGAPGPGNWRTAVFERGRDAFYERTARAVEAPSVRRALTAGEVAKVLSARQSSPRLYGILANVYYQKEEPVLEALNRAATAAARAEFERRYLEMARFAADNFVAALLTSGPNPAFSRGIHPRFKDKDRFDLVLLSMGYRANLEAPPGPAKNKTVVRSPEFDKQWGLDASRFREAHAVTRGKGVRVAVIDTGLDATHPIFKDTEFGRHFALVGRDGPPWEGASNMVDWGWHGTVVSSIVARYAPEARLTVYKGMDGDSMNDAPFPTILGHCLAAMIYKAVHEGNDVINISAGLGTDLPYLAEACRYAFDNNVVIVTGSSYYLGKVLGNPISVPGEYPTTISVTAIDRRPDGTYGYWPIAAPEVATTVGGPSAPFVAFPVYVPETDDYAPGISCATPIVASAAALVISRLPRTGAEGPGEYFKTIERLLTSTANPRILGYRGVTPECGAGLVDALEAVRLADRTAADRAGRGGDR